MHRDEATVFIRELSLRLTWDWARKCFDSVKEVFSLGLF